MKTQKADIVIAAAGTAGLAAAVKAAEQGKKVIVFEKSGHTGGSANLAAGLFAVESRLQKLKQNGLTKEEAFKIHMDFTHWRVDARLVKTFYEKSANTIDWLEGLGVEFHDIFSHSPGFNYTMHIIGGSPKNAKQGHLGAGKYMMKKLLNKANELGVVINLKSPVKRLISEKGCVTGVIALDKSNQEIEVHAGATILATGGFGGNTPVLHGLEGDGIRMAEEVGAETSKGAGVSKGGNGGDHHARITLWHIFSQPNLCVNLDGERFMNEEIDKTSPFSPNAIRRQRDRTSFMIFDEAIKDYFVNVGYYYCRHGLLYPKTKATDFDADLKEGMEKGDKSLYVADSIKDLAAQTGIDSTGLKRTIKEYNDACQVGRDDLFYKPAMYLKPIKQPKFYARKQVGQDDPSWEGIKINYKTEVLTPDCKVIPGLYATGNDAACNIYHDDYVGVLPGNTLGFAINSGCMAAENAIEYIESIK